MIFAGYDCKVWYKKEANTTYGLYDNTVPLGSGEWYNIPLIKSISFNWDSQHPSVVGLEQRTRRVGTTATYPVTKEDYSCSLEVEFEASEENSVCNLSTGGLVFYADIAHNNNSGQPQQFSFLVETDSLRDATWDVHTAAEASDNYWLLTGCYVNSVTISGSEGEYLKCSIELSVRDINYTSYATSDDIVLDVNVIYNDIAAPTLCPYHAATLTTTNFTTNEDKDTVSDFSITINNNFTKFWGLDAAIPYAATPGACEITGSFTKMFVNMTEFGEIDSGVNDTGTLTMVITCPTAGAQTITLENVNYNSLAMDLAETEAISQVMSFTASTVTLT